MADLIADQPPLKGVAEGSLATPEGIQFVSAVVLLAGLVLALFTGDLKIVYSVGFGGIVALINFSQLTASLATTLSDAATTLEPSSSGDATAAGDEENAEPVAINSGAGATITRSFIVRLALFGVALAGSLKAGWIEPLALVAGLAVTTVGLFCWFVIVTRRKDF